jgi:hypothetical protein
MEPSGKAWPFPGAPALYALIIAGFATITLRTSSVRAEETTDQFSYPLKSENVIPLGDGVHPSDETVEIRADYHWLLFDGQ